MRLVNFAKGTTTAEDINFLMLPTEAMQAAIRLNNDAVWAKLSMVLNVRINTTSIMSQGVFQFYPGI